MTCEIGVQKLCLGTVQMGMNYGVANALGRQPTSEESFAVLRTALECGIFCFDTASIYGNSEELLGEFHLASQKNVRIVSKFPPHMDDGEKAVLEELKKTLGRLQADHIDCYLLHDAEDMNRPGIVRGLQKAKEMGLTRRIGVSVYEPKDACEAVLKIWVDCVQVPYNVLDQRLGETEFFYCAKKYNVGIFARSPFLQGLLLMETEDVPSKRKEILPYLKKFREICHEYGFSKREAAFLFVLCHPGIDSVVFGVDTVSQLADNIEIAKKQENFSACYNALFGAFRGIDRRIINPSLWR